MSTNGCRLCFIYRTEDELKTDIERFYSPSEQAPLLQKKTTERDRKVTKERTSSPVPVGADWTGPGQTE